MRSKYLKNIAQAKIFATQDHRKLIYLSQNSLFLSLRSSQNIIFCTETPCTKFGLLISDHLIVDETVKVNLLLKLVKLK